MTLAVGLLVLAALVQWCVRRLRARIAGRSLGGLVPGTVVSVTRRSGSAFGEATRWNAVVVEHLDDAGHPQVVTQDAPGSGWWTPQVGQAVRLYRQAVWPGRVYRDRMSDRVGELLVECDERTATHLQWLASVIAAVALVSGVIHVVTT